MKMAYLLGCSAVAVSMFGSNTLNAQNTPTKLTQPVVNAQAQNQADINNEAQRDPRFTSRYGSARPAAAVPAPAAAPVTIPPQVGAPAPAAAPGAIAPQAPAPADDPRFTSRYGSARPQAARVATPAPAAAARPGAAPGAPGATVAAPAVATTPAPVRRPDPERDQRILNFQRQNAASGNRSAQYDLGMRYLRGNGVEQDDTQAMEWLKLAAQNGDSRAKKELAALQAKVAETAKEEPAPAKSPETK